MASNYAREFETGATRNTDVGKYDYEGFLHPLVLERYAEYMHKHRIQPDGSLRASDNWTKGIPKTAYSKSLVRHMMDVWLLYKGHKDVAVCDDIEESLCAVIFNSMGLLYEELMQRDIK